MEDIKNYKAKPPKVIGSTLINHALRVKMQLGCTEYVIMTAIIDLIRRGKPVTDLTMYQSVGIHPEGAVMMMISLIEKGYLFPKAAENAMPHVTDKWKSFFDSVEDEFDEFWNKEGAVCWTGSKPKAKELYIKRRESESEEFLTAQRDAYFEFLDVTATGGFNRPKMMCTVFLGPSERYKENWSLYLKDEKARQEKENNHPMPEEDFTPSTTTKADRQKKYEN